MYNENQSVTVKWNNSNREWYESKGYVYTKRYDSFDVLTKHLCPSSKVRINAICDYCGNEYTTQFNVIRTGRQVLNRDACPHCASKKANDVNKAKRADKSFQKLRDICEKNGYTLITEKNEFIDVKMDIQFKCPKHGIQTMILDNVIRGHKCLACSYESRFDSMKLSKEYIDKYISSINDNKWLNPEEYTNSIDRN